MLDDYFPSIEALRHATAHRGENEAHADEHAPEGEYALTGFRDGDLFCVPYKGKQHSIEISTTSLDLIKEVVAAYLLGFVPAADKLEAEGHLDD